jgi:hypothetical protein
MRKLVLILFLLCTTRFLGAQELSIKARVDGNEFAIGDWITVHVELVHPQGARFTAPESLEGFQIIQPLQVQKRDETHSMGTLVVARYEDGEATLPELTLDCAMPGETAHRTLKTEPIKLTIRTVEVDPSQEIKDLKPPMAIPWTLREIALYLLAGLAVLAVAFGAFFLWRRSISRKKGLVPALPPRPAHLVALEELDALQAKKLWQQGFVKEHHSEATEILRRYFENRFQILALEQTTDEILQALSQLPEAMPIRESAQGILNLADLVKFAKYQPIATEHERVVEEARGIVQKTVPTENGNA